MKTNISIKTYDGGVCAALSGGADSVALLYALINSGNTVAAAHLNHSLRGEASDADEQFCRELCERLGVPIVTERVSIETERRKGEGVEECARRVRYAFLVRAAQSQGCAYVATAHNANDNAETLLMNIARGCGLNGLRCIAPQRVLNVSETLEAAKMLEMAETLFVTETTGVLKSHDCNVLLTGLNNDCNETQIVGSVGSHEAVQSEERIQTQSDAITLIRPLLNVTRGAIEAYLNERGIGWVEDETNSDVSYTRNYIRHEVLPRMLHVNPRFVEHCSALIGDAIEEAERRAGAERSGVAHAVEEAARLRREAFVTGVRGGGMCGAIAPHSGIANAPPLRGASAMPQDAVTLSRRHAAAFAALLTGRPSAAISLPDGLVARREYDRLIIEPAAPAPLTPAPAPLSIGVNVWGDWQITVTHVAGTETRGADHRAVADDTSCASRESKLFVNALRFSDIGAMAVRSRRVGDAVSPLGAGWSKTVKKFLIDAKIPKIQRERYPIVTVSDAAAALPDAAVHCEFAAEAGEDALYISFQKIDVI